MDKVDIILCDAIPFIGALHAESGVVSIGNVGLHCDTPVVHGNMLGSSVWPLTTNRHELALVKITGLLPLLLNDKEI